jgi:hypothetical protein
MVVLGREVDGKRGVKAGWGSGEWRVGEWRVERRQRIEDRTWRIEQARPRFCVMFYPQSSNFLSTLHSPLSTSLHSTEGQS